jgi:hypothetical protein
MWFISPATTTYWSSEIRRQCVCWKERVNFRQIFPCRCELHPQSAGHGASPAIHLLAHGNEAAGLDMALARQQRCYVPKVSPALIQTLTTNCTESRIRIRRCGWSLVTGGSSMRYVPVRIEPVPMHHPHTATLHNHHARPARVSTNIIAGVLVPPLR